MPGAYRSPEHAEQVRDWCRSALGTWQAPHQSHDVETSLGRTHVVSLGDRGPLCVYLSGTNFNAATSTVLLEALAAHFRVYAADLPGQPGLSAAERPQDEVSGYARWLSEVLG